MDFHVWEKYFEFRKTFYPNLKQKKTLGATPPPNKLLFLFEVEDHNIFRWKPGKLPSSLFYSFPWIFQISTNFLTGKGAVSYFLMYLKSDAVLHVLFCRLV